MKVLLTGGSGFIGRHVRQELQSNGIEYIELQRRDPTDGNSFKFDLLNEVNLDDILRDEKPTHLIHLAWYAEHGKFWDSELNVQWILASHRLVESFCKAGGSHILISGTCAEYDWKQGYCVEEITPTNPNTLYGIAKNSTRNLIELTCRRYNTKLSWARIFFPYGVGESRQRLIPSLFDAFTNKTHPFGVNADCYRDFLQILDVSKAIVHCSKTSSIGAINISSAQPVSIKHIVEKIANLCNQNPDLILNLAPAKIDPVKLLIGANEKLRSIGWKQTITLEEGLLNYKPENSQ
jgi:nucleoside-diphosphate-sugar epimerase